MDETIELKERREAIANAQSEFYRVKNEKMKKEDNKSPGSNQEDNKRLQRERNNRASAAASRAKIICYAKELEKRTDRLELERNHQALRAEKAVKKYKSFKDTNKKLKSILRSLWELKNPEACSFLINSDSLFLIGNKEDSSNDSDSEEVSKHTRNRTHSMAERASVEQETRGSNAVEYYHVVPRAEEYNTSNGSSTEGPRMPPGRPGRYREVIQEQPHPSTHPKPAHEGQAHSEKEQVVHYARRHTNTNHLVYKHYALPASSYHRTGHPPVQAYHYAGYRTQRQDDRYQAHENPRPLQYYPKRVAQ